MQEGFCRFYEGERMNICQFTNCTDRYLFSKNKLIYFVTFLRKQNLISLFYVSSKCILIEGCLDVCIEKQNKNTKEDDESYDFMKTF